MSKKAEPIVIGKFGAVHGIKGWLKVHSYTDDPESIFEYKPLLMKSKGQFQEVNIADWKRHSNGFVAKIVGFDVREEAQALVGLELLVDSDKLPNLEEDFYWRDLIGCQVKTDNGYDLGVVTEIMETGSNDVLVVKANSNDAFGQKERLIPFIDKQVISNVDITSKLIQVNWEPDF
ncbi:16S rRNA processing protein RimM [Psychromonas ingrahamii 37]|uniref:Ribosome maturation factor RimM n=1 Tax=Psychromonas ingrahamii (strain DSM 17664 / CCUG 51855 / 37) TaxID=357804 RepID=RIMM_PSYIN|nr:ribosome maturation factor RimM [Psychromonas ingrahamii]A1SZY7.1 RecName: Full=Ribosome maturation factor RimM [Psychromonas ingrahamii 37]ABM05052.1 16S rRNA processing protein RimM [Psychromonas ingrahamii 37]